MSTNPATRNDPVSAGVGPRPAMRRRDVRRAVIGAAALAVVVLGVVGVRVAMKWNAAAAATAGSDGSFHVVASGPLVASISEAGTLRSSQAVVVKNELEGSSTILSIAPEGTTVQAGDLLVELDTSTLADKKVDQEITVQNSEASYVQARENLEIVRKQAEADISAAKVDLELAELDIQKYLEGEYKQLVQQAQTKITIADAELTRAAEKLDWSTKLAAEGYITHTELQADQLSKQKAELELDLARSELDLLQRFTHKRRLAELRSKVATYTFNLEKAQHKAQSNIVEADAKLRASDVSLKREQSKLDKMKDQLAKAKIHAPVSGMVVYSRESSSRWGSSEEPLKEGATVRERQSLIALPTTSGMVADIKIHESALDKVRTNLPVRVTVDALPNRVFNGYIEKIAVLPDSQDRWRTGDLTVFNSEIKITDDTSDLRPGMSCRAEVIIDQFADTLFVPIQCVLRVDGQPTVYVKTATGSEQRKVTVGLDNNRMIRIVDGLRAGEKVLLNPPMPPSVRRDPATNGAPGAPGGPADHPGAARDPAASPAPTGPPGSDAANPDAPRRRPDGAPRRPPGEYNGQRGPGAFPSGGAPNGEARPSRRPRPAEPADGQAPAADSPAPTPAPAPAP